MQVLRSIHTRVTVVNGYIYMHLVAVPLHLDIWRVEVSTRLCMGDHCQEEYKMHSSLVEKDLSEAKEVPRVKPKALSKQTQHKPKALI